MYTYSIYIDPLTYVAKLNDSDAKIVWEKTDDSVIFRKRLDGKFSMNRTGNELLFDAILNFSFCQKGILTLTNQNATELIEGTFMKKNLTISEDKCRIDIKFDKLDEYTCLDGIQDKDYNILFSYTDLPIAKRYIKMFYGKVYEYTDCYGYATYNNNYIIGTGWTNLTGINGMPVDIYSCFPPNQFWSFYRNSYLLDGVYTDGGANSFQIITTHVREIKLVPRLGNTASEVPFNDPDEPCDKWAWNFAEITEINGVLYDKFVRYANTDFPLTVGSGTGFVATDMYTLTLDLTCIGTEYKYERARKLNDVIASMIYTCFQSGFKSEFFQSTINPISGRDLSNLMLSQKSDCIDPSTSDPATKGILTFKKLMDYLYMIFQVRWGIVNGELRIEHQKYWDNNGSYTVANQVGIDLPVIYPMSLLATNEYSFEQKSPIRETFKWMESWNIDFTGLDIDYSSCISTGETIDNQVSEIVTDIDPAFLTAYASKEGFCLFHCSSEIDANGYYPVIAEEGLLTHSIIANAHLSWANLHDSYWKYGRYLPEGLMNGQVTTFQVRPLKYQVPIKFPYCFEDFDPNLLIRTRLGDGSIKSASFALKTSWFTVELQYIDNN